MTDAERKLLQLLTERSFRRGQFTLASGQQSTYYIDGKMSQVYSKSARLIGQVIYERTRDLGIDAIGGLEVGAVPLTAAAVCAYDEHGREMEGFWVRNQVKDHGTRKLVEGGLRPRARVCILDDVVTTGGSSVKAIEAVKAMECEVVLALTLVDRLQGAEQSCRQHGAKDYRAVFTIRDFGVT